MLMPRLLPFTFCFLLLVAQLPLCLLGLPPDFSRPSPAARDRQRRQRPETDRTSTRDRQMRQRLETGRRDSYSTPDIDPRLDSDRAHARRPLRPTYFAPPDVFFVTFVVLSRCSNIEFPELTAPPSCFNIIHVGTF